MSEKVSLTDLINEQKPKGENRIGKYFLAKMTPEEQAEWRAQAAIKRKETFKKKKEEQNEAIAKAKALVPEVIAMDLAREATGDKNWVPRQDTIDKIKRLLSKDMTLEKLRERFFKDIKDDTWHKIIKFCFKSQISQSEDLGEELLRGRNAHIQRIKKSIREVKKQMKYHCEEKKTKVVPFALLSMKKDLESELMQLEIDLSKTLFQVGAVGEKSKAPSLHVHLATPRPIKVVEEE